MAKKQNRSRAETTPASALSEGALYNSIFPKELSKGERKKLEIVEVAADMFTERGAAFTYDDIAKVLKTNRSHITYHFKERSDLEMAVIRMMMSQAHEFSFRNLRLAHTAVSQMGAYVDSLFDFFVDNPRWSPVYLYFFFAAGTRGPTRDLQSQVRDQAHGRIKELIRNIYLDRRQTPPLPVTIDDSAFQIQSALIGAMVLNISTGAELPSVASVKSIKAAMRATVERILGEPLF